MSLEPQINDLYDCEVCESEERITLVLRSVATTKHRFPAVHVLLLEYLRDKHDEALTIR